MSDYSENEYDMAALMQEAIECLPNGLCIMDEAMRPIITNQLVVDAFPHYFASIAAGADFIEANFAGVRHSFPGLPDEKCWAVARTISAHMLEGKAINLRTADGRVFRAHYSLMESGCYVAVYVDISDLKNRERELDLLRREAETANRLKSAFLANMSHEIRTPLNGILGMAQGLAQGPLDPDLEEQVDIILESGNTLKSLLDDVLDLSKIETGHMELAAVDTDLTQVLRRQHSLWMPRADEKGVALVLDVAEGVPGYVRIDPIRLGQCLSNLIANAIKFTERGEVRVTVSRTDEGRIAFAVSDTGIGMDRATLDRLFTPFAQADSSISRRFGGTGLGLVITRRLAQLMGGDVAVDSREGRGSTFTLTVAAEVAEGREPQAPATQARQPAAESKGGRILLVDDHAINRRVARMFLTPSGYQVTEAENGQQALECLERDSFDLILLDIHMPVLDGPTTLRRLRASGRSWSGLPVIAVTADAMSGDRERYLAEGMNGYIAKPIDKGELLAEIARLLNDAKAAPASPPPPVLMPAATAPAAPAVPQAAPDAETGLLPAKDNGRTQPTGRDYKITDIVQEAIEALPNGFAIIGSDLKPIMSNARSKATFTDYYEGLARGLSYEEANYLGVKRVMAGHPEEEIRKQATLIADTLRAGGTIELRPGDGRIYRTTYRRMSKARYVAVSIDVTDERQQQKALHESRRQAEAANHAKSSFLANMSHEIRTPLNGILGMAQVMVQSELTPEQHEQAVAILDSGKALKALLDDVLDLAKIDAGRLELAPAECEARLFDRQFDKWRHRGKAKGVRFSAELEPSVPESVRIDPVRFGQCLANLLSNAVKFTEPGGEVRVTVRCDDRPEGTLVTVEVADTGIGMSAETLKRLFTPFTQGDSSTTRRYRGTGLGLVITQKLAALMGGGVTVASQEGKGSVFTLTVMAEPVETASKALGRRVLLVDDHAINRRIGRMFLEPEGYAVTEAGDGAEALRLLRGGAFDLVLLDIQMPILDGLQTLRCIRQSGASWASIPVIALVADAAEEDCERYLREGMIAVVGKPIEQRDLLTAVSRARRMRRPEAPDPAIAAVLEPN